MQDDNIMDNHLKPSKMRSVSNMAEIYIVVVTNSTQDTTTLRKASEESHAIGILADIEGDNRVDRVFKVDEFGDVTHYTIVFEGKLKLREME